MNTYRITHTVFFTLNHEPNSKETDEFLAHSSSILSKIPYVENFKVLKQTSSKNQYDFGFFMEFADKGAYDAYNNHSTHVQYVENIWKKDVKEFMEIDYTLI
jgi:hypothetical protein